MVNTILPTSSFSREQRSHDKSTRRLAVCSDIFAMDNRHERTNKNHDASQSTKSRGHVMFICDHPHTLAPMRSWYIHPRHCFYKTEKDQLIAMSALRFAD